MALEIKYQKVDANNMRKYFKDNELINKQDLIDKKSDYQTMLQLTNNQKTIIIEEFGLFSDITAFDAHFQAKYDEVDALLDYILTGTTTPETINWFD